MNEAFPLTRLARRVQALSQELPFARPVGEVRSVTPSALAVEGLSQRLRLGSLVEIATPSGPELAEVIRLDHDAAVCKPFSANAVVGLGSPAYPRGELACHPDESWKGRVIDALGRAVDGGGPLHCGSHPVRLQAAPPAAMQRKAAGGAAATGVKVIDVFTPLCFGQRIGVFAGSGVGKSTLLSMMAKTQSFDSVVIALVGERGREVREFIEHTLGEAMRKAVTVVATGDESAMMRRLAPLMAMAIAERFRDAGQNVLLVMDSVTRYAHACREVALAAGEPPVARGYPPSVFASLPQLLERAGPGAEGKGSITGVFSVLVDGDDHNDPVADAVRGILDGHIVLDRAVAEQGRYPAVNVLASLSRLAPRVWSADQAKAASELKRLIARFEDTRDLRAMGGYAAGADPELDKAIDLVPRLYRALSQGPGEAAASEPFRAIAAALSGEG